VIGRDN